MKKCLFIITMLVSISTAFSQDVITKKTGEDISAKISEITQTEIKYKKFDNLEGPLFTMLKSDVLIVRYENGTKDIFNDEIQAVVTNQPNVMLDSDEELISKAKDDAKVNYRGAKSGAGWTAATTVLFSPIIGIIPAAACASASPADENLNFRNDDLMRNSKYSKAYIDEAHKIKKKKVWTSFAVGSSAWLLLLLLF